MKKNLCAAVLLFICNVISAQIGINNPDPKATLDIAANTSDGSRPEGIIAPRLTGDQIKAADVVYGVDQKGTLIYATTAVTAASVKTANITAEGYYFFDGNIWQKVTGTNYTGSSSVTLDGNSFQRAALSGDVTSPVNSNATTVVGLQGAAVATTVPVADDLLNYNGTNWAPRSTASLGIPKQVVSVSVPGTQNELNSNVLLLLTTENFDLYNAWTNSTFTVPANMQGTYTVNMQTSNAHTASSNPSTWWTILNLEKSVDNGTNWARVTSDIRTGTPLDVDNGNILFWTGNLNVNDKLRVRVFYNGDTNNIILLGNLAITKL
jgi:hypothetical protein